MLRLIKHLLEYGFVRAIVFCFNLLSYRTAQRAGGTVLGWLTYRIGGSRRRMVARNLEQAFPELSEAERSRLVREQFQNVGYISAEFVKQPVFDREWMDRYVEWEPKGVEFVERCLKEKRGVIINSCHFGNWEIIPVLLPMKFPVLNHAIGANISNPFTHQYVWERRQRPNLVFVTVDEMGATVIKALKKGEIFAIASDQSAGNRGVFVPYFGRPASTHTGASQIAYLSGAEMVFMVSVRLPEGRFRMELVPLGKAADFSTDREEAIRILTLRYVDILEQYVRKYPGQYFWLHNRWKISPGPEAVHWERIATDLKPAT